MPTPTLSCSPVSRATLDVAVSPGMTHTPSTLKRDGACMRTMDTITSAAVLVWTWPMLTSVYICRWSKQGGKGHRG